MPTTSDTTQYYQLPNGNTVEIEPFRTTVTFPNPVYPPYRSVIAGLIVEARFKEAENLIDVDQLPKQELMEIFHAWIDAIEPFSAGVLFEDMRDRNLLTEEEAEQMITHIEYAREYIDYAANMRPIDIPFNEKRDTILWLPKAFNGHQLSEAYAAEYTPGVDPEYSGYIVFPLKPFQEVARWDAGELLTSHKFDTLLEFSKFHSAEQKEATWVEIGFYGPHILLVSSDRHYFSSKE